MSDYTPTLQDRFDTPLRAVEHMTRVALTGEGSGGDEDDLRSLCACIGALGLQAQEDAQ